MASTRKKTLSRQQRMRRQSLDVVRVEVTLNNNILGDSYISDYLDTLEGRTKSDFVRAALLTKIAQETGTTPMDDELRGMRERIDELQAQNTALLDAVDQLVALVNELANREIVVQMAQAAQVTVGPAQPDDALTQASGLDMSRGRPRKPLVRGPVVEQAIDVTDEFDPVALARQMSQSVGAFGTGKYTQ